MMSYETSLKTWAILILAGVAILVGSRAEAFIYTVGRSGTGQNCSFAGIQQALNAAAASAEDDEIWITRDVAGGYYQNQALQISGFASGKIKIVGGLDDCRDVTPDGTTELHGNGGPKAPVLQIYGGDVTLSHLRFTRGDNDANGTRAGGGVAFTGKGKLSLLDVLIDRNTAGRGAGLAITATGGRVDVEAVRTEISDNNPALTFGGGILLDALDDQAVMVAKGTVRINRNYARLGGGGIAMSGTGVAVFVASSELLMEANGTPGEGGAILAVAPSHIAITASPFAGALGVFVGNEAKNGGAIALSSHPDLGLASGDANVVLYSGNFNSPQVLAANRANEHGGAIYINRPSMAGPLDGASRVCSFNVGYDRNDAPLAGSAVAAVGGSASFRNQAHECGLLEDFCAHLACNQFSGHEATLGNGLPSGTGSLFDVQDSADIQLFGARIAYNTVPWLFRTNGSVTQNPSVIGVDTALIYRNTGTSTAMTQCNAATCLFDMVASTIVGNTFTGPVFTNTLRNFYLQESIVDQPGQALFMESPTGPGSMLAHVVYTSNYASSIPTVRHGDPGFMNVAGMDYRLSGTSQAIDNLPERNGVDFVGRPRNVDISSRPNGLGPRDLGAVEAQHWEVGDDVILRSGFD